MATSFIGFPSGTLKFLRGIRQNNSKKWFDAHRSDYEQFYEEDSMIQADEELVDRIRELMRRRRGYSEKKMFGGVCFMINGNMCVGPWKGALIVRLDRDLHEETQSEPHVKPMDITGKVMKGWALVEPDGIASHADLKEWIDRGVRYVRTLPPK